MREAIRGDEGGHQHTMREAIRGDVSAIKSHQERNQEPSGPT